jgi:hypothetical protein
MGKEMPMAGYSGTPLVQKLGIRAHHLLALINSPEAFAETLDPLPEGVTLQNVLDGDDPFDVIVLFTANRTELRRRFSACAERLIPSGGLWVAWPKKASGVATDLTEDVVRAEGLAAGLVDNKVCAVDEIWSGLRFVFRLKDRPRKKK